MRMGNADILRQEFSSVKWGIRCADYATPLYSQKLALTSPTSCGLSVGIVRSRTQATEFKLAYTRCDIT
jgi:hypothetical protein